MRLSAAFCRVATGVAKIFLVQPHLHVHVLGAGGVHGQVGEVDVSLQRGRELHLGLLGRLPHPLERHVVLGEVDALSKIDSQLKCTS